MMDVVSLLPSETLRERIVQDGWVFPEKDTLLILYRYARSQEERLSLLTAFAEAASAVYAEIAGVLLSWEREKLERFRTATDGAGYVYEMCIEDVSAEWTEACLCATYEDALAAVGAYFAAYAEVDAGPEEPYRFSIRKRPVLAKGMPWPQGTPASCRVDAAGRVLAVEDCSEREDGFLAALRAAYADFDLYDELVYPFFVAAGQLVRYTDDHYPHAKAEYGICTDDFGQAASTCVYVYPLMSDAVRLCDVSDEERMFDHEHIDAPLCADIPPEEIPDGTMRMRAAAFWAAYSNR